ncbi:MAG TPA: PHB depolymerase family esterase [Pirellulales bacterium]|jgi:polyhydroxybutyrate depolymerase|nr:PHB depolymerase family esterase [Pirellulales bacterium]
MHAALLCCLLAVAADVQPLSPGSHDRTLQVDNQERSYQVYVPPKYDPKHPTPVVLVLHGAYTNGPITAIYSGLNRTADERNFIAVYPNGTALGDTKPQLGGAALFWNCSDRTPHLFGSNPPNDVKFLGAVLDDLGTVANVDPNRIYATGISNGGMMCYALAAGLSDRIAAIAPIAGSLCLDNVHLKRPVSVLHFHGTDDKLVPYAGARNTAEGVFHCKSVDGTMTEWAKLDGCPEKPQVEELPKKEDDGTSVKRYTYGPGKDGSEVMLIQITGGGHTWPNRPMLPALETALGKTTHQISANDMMWDFFDKHPMSK